MLLNMTTKEAATAAEETLAPVSGKEKEIVEDTSEERILIFKTYLVKSCIRLRRKS
jgi:hypothetical protein